MFVQYSSSDDWTYRTSCYVAITLFYSVSHALCLVKWLKVVDMRLWTWINEILDEHDSDYYSEIN